MDILRACFVQIVDILGGCFLFFNHFPYPISPAAHPFDFSLLSQFCQVLPGISLINTKNFR